MVDVILEGQEMLAMTTDKKWNVTHPADAFSASANGDVSPLFRASATLPTIQKLAAKFNCSFIAIHHSRGKALSCDNIVIAGNLPKKNPDQKQEFHAELSISIVQKVQNTITPFPWALEVISTASLTKGDKCLADFLGGFHEVPGLIIPVHGPGDNIGIVALGQMAADLSKTQIVRLQSASIDLFDVHFKNRQKPLNEKIRLTERETGILQLLVEGKTVDEIARLKNLSPFVIEAYAASAKSKLNSTTRIHAAAQAIRNGVIG